MHPVAGRTKSAVNFTPDLFRGMTKAFFDVFPMAPLLHSARSFLLK